jgi:hypothetical protein
MEAAIREGEALLTKATERAESSENKAKRLKVLLQKTRDALKVSKLSVFVMLRDS